ANPFGAAHHRAGIPVALLARPHREQPYRFARTQDRDVLATLTHPVARSPAPRANDRLPTPKFFPRVRLNAGPRALRLLQSFRRRRSFECRSQPTKGAVRLLPPGQVTVHSAYRTMRACFRPFGGSAPWRTICRMPAKPSFGIIPSFSIFGGFMIA